MNEQKVDSKSSIEWTRIVNPDGTTRRGYTWNVVGGCQHDCKWLVDGQIAECYAKTIAERVATASFPNGFEHHYFHTERLQEPLKLKGPAGIFIDSMSDL